MALGKEESQESIAKSVGVGHYQERINNMIRKNDYSRLLFSDVVHSPMIKETQDLIKKHLNSNIKGGLESLFINHQTFPMELVIKLKLEKTRFTAFPVTMRFSGGLSKEEVLNNITTQFFKDPESWLVWETVVDGKKHINVLADFFLIH